MTWAYVSDVGSHEGEDVTVKGWLYNKRSSGKLHFLLIRDGTGVIQAVVSHADVLSAVFEAAGRLTQESSVSVSGRIRADVRSPGGYELAVSDLQPYQIAEDYPITPKDHGVDFLMSHRHLWLRSSRQLAILRIRATIIKAIRDYLDGNGF